MTASGITQQFDVADPFYATSVAEGVAPAPSMTPDITRNFGVQWPSAAAPLARTTSVTWRYRLAKTVMDYGGASVALLFVGVLMVALAVAIKASSRGPIFFTQERAGLGGRPFRCIKFRTMVENAEKLLDDPLLLDRYVEGFKIADDPRVTRVGRFLRKSSLDELPQLFNVLLGHMSLVGPRPMLEWEVDAKYGPARDVVLGVKPGMTGLWQVSGRSAISYSERVALDLEYVRDRSVLTDLAIIAKTPVAVLSARGAH